MKWFKALWNEAQYIPAKERFWWLFLGFWSILSRNFIVNTSILGFLMGLSRAGESVEVFLVNVIILSLLCFFFHFEIFDSYLNMISVFLFMLMLTFVFRKSTFTDVYFLETMIIFSSLIITKILKSLFKADLK